jgi:hypothetical protein
MPARIGRLVIIAAIGTAAIVTQRLVSATTTAVAQMERTDSMLAELTNTVNTLNDPLLRLVRMRETELGALASDVDAAFDHSLARISGQLVETASPAPGVEEQPHDRSAAAHFAALAIAAIDVERQALVSAMRAAASADPSPFHATGSRSIELHARKLASSILSQREILEVAKQQALRDAETIVTCSSAAALLMMAYFIRRPVLAAGLTPLA